MQNTEFGEHIRLINILIDFLSEELSHLQGGSPIFYPHSVSFFSACTAKLGLWGLALSHFPQKVTACWRTKLQLLLSICTGYSFLSLIPLSTNTKFYHISSISTKQIPPACNFFPWPSRHLFFFLNFCLWIKFINISIILAPKVS